MNPVKIIISLLFISVFADGCSSSDTSVKTESTSNIDTMNWDIELCSKSGSFDTKKYSKDQLYNTLFLLNMYFYGNSLQTRSSVFDYKDISTLDSAALEQEYSMLKNKIQSMPIIDQMPWIKLKQTNLDALKENYKIKRTEIMAYRYPQVLLSHPYSVGCPELVEILYNQDTLKILDAWKNQVSEQAKRNGYPQRLIDEFEVKNKLPERVEIAKAELITFGWPCKERIYNSNDFTLYEDAFDRLFLSVRVECTEP